MKVVLFCGGLGLRMRDGSETVPKPMVPIGDRPILLHIMRYYAHYGHTEFILCLGYKGHVFKEFFLNYNEALRNDFSLADGGRTVRVFRRDLEDWRITFLDTGLQSNIGQRLCAAREHLGDDELFLANYGDGLSDAPLPTMIERLVQRDRVASFLCVRPTQSLHVVALRDDLATGIYSIGAAGLWINGGFFVFRREIFDYIRDGEELVEAPFRRLIEQEQLLAYRHEGFWAAMDTFKDRQNLEALCETGRPPWAVWEGARRPIAANGQSH